MPGALVIYCQPAPASRFQAYPKDLGLIGVGIA